MKKNNFLHFFTLVLTFTSTVFLAQETIYVSSTGSGTMDGTSEGNSYSASNFSSALADINSSGDILRIVGDISLGTNYDFNDKNFPFSIEGDSGGSTITGTDGKLRLFTITAGTDQDVTFKNLIFTNFTNSTGQGGVFYSQTNGEITFENCVFSGNSSVNTNGGGAVNITAATIATFTGCTFYNNSNNTGLTTTGQGGAILFGGGLTANLTNCTFFQNSISRANDDFGAAIRIIGSTSVTILNCLFYDNKIENGTGTVADVGAQSNGVQNFTNSLAQLINANIDVVTNSIVFKKGTSTSAANLTNSNLTWNATTNQVEFTAPSSISDNTPIDFGNDNNDVGSWDSQINLFKGTTDSDWATGSNWSSTEIPISSENVTLLSDSPALVIGITTGAVCNDLSVNGSSSLTISSGGSLIVNGSSTGNLTYNRNLPTLNQWYLVSSPVSGETIEDMRTNHTFVNGSIDTNHLSFAPYNNAATTSTQRWDYITNSTTGTLGNAQGYLARLIAAGNISFTGAMNTSDFTAISLTDNSGASGTAFNFLGNPYPSYINISSLLTANDSGANNLLTESTIWIWNGSTYEARNSGTASPNDYIAPAQGFFVSADGSSSTFTITEAMQSHQGTDSFQKTVNTRPEIKLVMYSNGSVRDANLFYIEGTTTDFDNGYDSSIFSGLSNSLEVYTSSVSGNSNKRLGIQSLPNSDYENMVVPVGVKAASGKELIFTSEAINLPEGIKVYLEDRENSTFTELTNTNDYKVTLNTALDGTGRFFLHTRSSALSTDDVSLTGIGIYSVNKNTLRISGVNTTDASVKVYNILGRKVVDQNFLSKGVYDVSLPNLNTGVYIVQLSTEKGKISKKIVIE